MPSRKIRNLLTPTATVAVTVVLLLAGVAVVLYGERSYKQEKLHEVRVQAQILAAMVTAALAFEDRKGAQEYVNALRSNPEVEAAAIYDQSGALFVGYARGAETVPRVLHSAGSPYAESGYLTLTEPVRQREAALGTVYIRTLVEPLSRRLTRYSMIALFITMAVLVAAVLGFAHAAQRKANAELERRARELSEANANLRAQIAARESAETALRQAQKMEAMGQLTGGLAHDFNNLLQVLMLNLTGLLWTPTVSGNPELRRLVETGIGALERGAGLTKQLLAFGRRQPLSPKPFDVNRLVGQMMHLIYPALGELVRVELALAADLWRASADPHQLESALLNLAVNARDAMPGGGTLTIATGNQRVDGGSIEFGDLKPGDYVWIAVTDTGTGMSRAVLEKAFEPFFTTKEVGKGTGLGLSQVYGYAKQSSGDVKIHSEPGQGTRVAIFLPRAVEAAAPEPAAKLSAPQQPGGRTETVLVVEDEEMLLNSAVDSLKRLGYVVLAAGDASAALEILKGPAAIDILFSDIVMPGEKNGVELAVEARRLRPGLKVLLTSGYAGAALDADSALDGLPLLRKPYGLEELVIELRKLEPAR